jgi:hypothetical protein
VVIYPLRYSFLKRNFCLSISDLIRHIVDVHIPADSLQLLKRKGGIEVFCLGVDLRFRGQCRAMRSNRLRAVLDSWGIPQEFSRWFLKKSKCLSSKFSKFLFMNK